MMSPTCFLISRSTEIWIISNKASPRFSPKQTLGISPGVEILFCKHYMGPLWVFGRALNLRVIEAALDLRGATSPGNERLTRCGTQAPRKHLLSGDGPGLLGV